MYRVILNVNMTTVITAPTWINMESKRSNNDIASTTSRH